MPLESGSYISDLVVTNPVATDPVSRADDHMRLIKATIKNTFPNITGPVTLTQDNLNRGGIPVGAIVLWSGSVASIPAGWALCDGNNGTPDLTGTFVRHADADTGGSFAPGDQGGSSTDSITTSSDGAHTHTALAGGDHDHGGSTASHALTEDQLPVHSHTLTSGSRYGRNRDTETGGTFVPVMDGWNENRTLSSASSTIVNSGPNLLGNAHSHNISSSGTHTHTTDSQGDHTHTATVDTVPPFYALAYIMRLAD